MKKNVDFALGVFVYTIRYKNQVISVFQKYLPEGGYCYNPHYTPGVNVYPYTHAIFCFAYGDKVAEWKKYTDPTLVPTGYSVDNPFCQAAIVASMLSICPLQKELKNLRIIKAWSTKAEEGEALLNIGLDGMLALATTLKNKNTFINSLSIDTKENSHIGYKYKGDVIENLEYRSELSNHFKICLY